MHFLCGVAKQKHCLAAGQDGRESYGIGVARTKKESERVAAIDACMQLQVSSHPEFSSGWVVSCTTRITAWISHLPSLWIKVTEKCKCRARVF